MVLNVRLDGELENLINSYIHRGLAASKVEVIRMGLNKLREEDYEDISDDPELEKYLMDVQSGKIKPKFVGKNKDLDKLLKG